MTENDKEFLAIINGVIDSDEFRKMKSYRQHRNGNTYEHSLKVARKCFDFCKTYKIKIDLKKLVRGALLHDFFLYNRHHKERKDYKCVGGLRHLFTHPKIALKNAKKRYPTLSYVEEDIIKRHMFPLTVIPPRTKAGWIVCYFDKVVAISDYLNLGQV